METQVKDLQIGMAELKTNLKNFGDKLSEHVAMQKETDKKVDANFAKIFDKIDHLADTFQTRIGDKVDQREIVSKFSEMDEKFAPKDTQWAEKFLAWTGMVIGAIVIAGLLGLVAAGYVHLAK
jgi:uncharacterized membrane-anchored protein YhcB (DUF1043 family)